MIAVKEREIIFKPWICIIAYDQRSIFVLCLGLMCCSLAICQVHMNAAKFIKLILIWYSHRRILYICAYHLPDDVHTTGKNDSLISITVCFVRAKRYRKTFENRSYIRSRYSLLMPHIELNPDFNNALFNQTFEQALKSSRPD